MFRIIIKYSSLRDFGLLGNNGNRSILVRGILKDDIFWLVLNLEISHRVITSCFFIRGFFENYIFAL